MKIAEKRLRDYPNYDKEIRYRKWDLEHRETDLNAEIKSKNRTSNPTESVVLAWEKDPYIQNRIFWKKCVEETLAELDEKQRQIVKEYYFDNVYGYRDLGTKYLTNRNVVMNACKRACKILSQKLGEEIS